MKLTALAHFFAALALTATVHAQTTAAPRSFVRPLPVPCVTFDVVGTYPPNIPDTPFTEPNAAFMIEFTVPQVDPAITLSTFAVTTPVLSAEYMFHGWSHRATSGYYDVHNHNGQRSLTVTMPAGTLTLWTISYDSTMPSFPGLCYPTRIGDPPQGQVTYSTGDMGGCTACNLSATFHNGTPDENVNGVVIWDVVGRLVTPNAAAALAQAE